MAIKVPPVQGPKFTERTVIVPRKVEPVVVPKHRKSKVAPTTTVRFPVNVKRDLQLLADQQGRTFTGMVLFILRKYLRDKDIAGTIASQHRVDNVLARMRKEIEALPDTPSKKKMESLLLAGEKAIEDTDA